MTWGGWVYTASTSQFNSVLHYGVGLSTGYELYHSPYGARYKCRAADTYSSMASATAQGAWAFMACTWDGATLRAYQNGLSPPTSVARSAAFDDIGASLYMGQTSTGIDKLLGSLDEVGIINNRALTEAEICRWCSCGIRGEQCQCDGASPAVYVSTGRNATACNSCALPACNAGPPPDGMIDVPAVDATVEVGGTVTFAGSGGDPGGNLPLSFRWSFGGAGVPDQFVEDPGPVQFLTPGTFTVTLNVTNSQGLSDPTPATRVVTVLSAAVEVPPGQWQLWRVDSEELATAYNPAEHAFDGNPATFWRSRLQPLLVVLPHDLQVNLGGLYQLMGLRYLPRQEVTSEGRVGQYKVYVSADGMTWGTAVASGTWANHGAAKEVTFAPVVGQFVRLQALSDLGGSTVTSVAELTLLGQCVIPSVTVAPPQDYALQSEVDLAVTADACLDPAAHVGWGVRLGVDGGAPVDLYTAPFSHTFAGLAQAEHTVTAQLIDGAGAPVGGAAGQDQLVQVGIGRFYVAVGDSITDGVGDNVPGDDTSPDGRDRSLGYPPVLNGLLTTATGKPHTVVNRGAPGARSAWGAAAMPGLLAKYPQAQRILILLGTNDATIFMPLPSGLGLNPGDPGYPGSYKANLQAMLDAINNAAGKEPVLLKVPVTLADCGSCPRYPDPDTGQRNVQLVKPYNQVIDELVANPANNITVPPPDLYAYFLQTYQAEYADVLHPNGVGYQSMARVICQAITQTACN